MLSNKKLNPIVTEIFIRDRKLKIYLVFHMMLFCCTNNIRLNSTHYFVMKTPKKQELQQVAFNYSLNIDFKDFTKRSLQTINAKPYSFSVLFSYWCYSCIR